MEALEGQGLVAVEQDGRRLMIRLAHPLYGEVLRHHTPTLRARAVCRQLADTLASMGMRRREDLLRLATWRLDGGDPTRPNLLAEAARRAASADSVVAERLARAAVQAGGGFDAGLALGRALYGQRRFQEAERVLAGLAELPLTDVQRTELAIERSDSLRGLYRYAEATGELQAAVIVTDHGLRDRLTTCVAESLLLDGRVAEALDTVSAVLTHESTDETTFAQAVWITSWALVRAGRASEAIDIIRLQERLGSRWQGRDAQAPWGDRGRVGPCVPMVGPLRRGRGGRSGQLPAVGS
jgi:Tetratrico peptide repeat